MIVMPECRLFGHSHGDMPHCPPLVFRDRPNPSETQIDFCIDIRPAACPPLHPPARHRPSRHRPLAPSDCPGNRPCEGIQHHRSPGLCRPRRPKNYPHLYSLPRPTVEVADACASLLRSRLYLRFGDTAVSQPGRGSRVTSDAGPAGPPDRFLGRGMDCTHLQRLVRLRVLSLLPPPSWTGIENVERPDPYSGQRSR